MHLIIKEKNKVRLNKFIEWLIYMVCYTLVFMLVSKLFSSMQVDTRHFYLYSTLIVFIIYILNKTIKPILVTITIPLTGITLGLFYPFINLFIIKLADWILGPHFELDNIFIALLVAILLSIVNIILEESIKKIIKKVKKHG
ncbi:MAG: phage holin family protein [bacterium]|nr:phage holin family protein [bacterium]